MSRRSVRKHSVQSSVETPAKSPPTSPASRGDPSGGVRTSKTPVTAHSEPLHKSTVPAKIDTAGKQASSATSCATSSIPSPDVEGKLTRKSQKHTKKGNLDVSTESSPPGASTAKSEASYVATIPPVLQQKSSKPRPVTVHTADKNKFIETTMTPPAPDSNVSGVNDVHKPRVLHDAGSPCISHSPVQDSSALQRGPLVSGVKFEPSHGKAKLCRNFILGICKRDRCHRQHVVVGGSECRSFKLGSCVRGDSCPLRHVPYNEPCRDFKRGLCSRGSQCRYLHIVPDASNSTSSKIEAFAPQPTTVDESDLCSQSLSCQALEAQQNSGLSNRPASTDPPCPPLTRDSSEGSLRSQDSTGDQEVCRLYLLDRCPYGSRCFRRHPPRYEWHKYLLRSDHICERYLEGRCFVGNNCCFRHPAEASSSVSGCTPSTILAPRNAEAVPKAINHSSAEPKCSTLPPRLQATNARRSTTTRQSKREGQENENIPVVSESTASSTISCGSTAQLASERTTIPRLAEDQASIAPCREYLLGRCTHLRCQYLHDIPKSNAQQSHNKTNELAQLIEQSARGISAARARGAGISRSQASGRSLQRSNLDGCIPVVPPGLGLTAHATHQANHTKDRFDVPVSMSLAVLDSVSVRLGPGFLVQEIVTGFESKTLILKNIPVQVTPAGLSQALAPFGEIRNIQLPEDKLDMGTMTVKVTFATSEAARVAASTVDRTRLFANVITARLSSQHSTSLGKGTIRDGDVYLQFPAPCRTAFIGYATWQAARQAIEMADGAEMREMMLSAFPYHGMPTIGTYNVKFCGLPANTNEKELEVFGPHEGIMLQRSNYSSLDDSLKSLQSCLEQYGDLVSLKVISPPFTNGTVRAWAHFTSPQAADAACQGLAGQRQRFLNWAPIHAEHVLSLQYRIPSNVFDALCENFHQLRSCVATAMHRGDIIFYNKRRQPGAPVAIKLVADSLASLNKLKTSFEQVLKGQLVHEDSRLGGEVKPAWDHFFSRPPGAAFLSALEGQHVGVIIQRDLRRSQIRLFGPYGRLKGIHQTIRAKIAEIRAQRVHSFPLDSSLVVSLFMNPNLMELQRELGPERVYIDTSGPALRVSGDGDTLQVVKLILQHARQRPLTSQKKTSDGCPVCLDKVSLPVSLDCGHTWCKACLSGFLRAAVDTQVFPLNCLGNDARCAHPISLKIARQILSGDDFYRIGHASFLAYIHSRPSEFHYCPTPDCPQVYRTAPPETVLQCPSCLVRICANCHVEYHEGFRCPDRETEDSKLFEEWSSKHDVKRCPGCKVPIERAAGCNHMTCTRCKTHICWVCLETFPEGDDVYDHMRAIHGGIGL